MPAVFQPEKFSTTAAFSHRLTSPKDERTSALERVSVGDDQQPVARSSWQKVKRRTDSRRAVASTEPKKLKKLRIQQTVDSVRRKCENPPGLEGYPRRERRGKVEGRGAKRMRAGTLNQSKHPPCGSKKHFPVRIENETRSERSLLTAKFENGSSYAVLGKDTDRRHRGHERCLTRTSPCWEGSGLAGPAQHPNSPNILCTSSAECRSSLHRSPLRRLPFVT